MPLAALLALIFACTAAPAEPLWRVSLGDSPLSAPLIADLHKNPGLETFVLALHTATAHCVAADGKILWTAELHTQTRDIPPARARREAQPPLILCPLAQGAIAALDATDGRELWRSETLGPEIQTLFAAPTDDDSHETPMLLLPHALVALDPTGKIRWRFPEDRDTDTPCQGAAAQDVDNDGTAEIFLLLADRVLRLDADGRERWSQNAPDNTPFAGAPRLADTEGDEIRKLYCPLQDGNIAVFDADLGDPLPLITGTKQPPQALVAGDINGDQRDELLALLADHPGLALLPPQAKQLAAPGPLRHLLLANTNYTSPAELIATTAAGAVHALDLWSGTWTPIAPENTAAQPPAIAELDGITGAELLCAAADGTLACYRLDGPHVPMRAPWPQAGGGPARNNAVPTAEQRETDTNGAKLVPESRDLLRWIVPASGFAPETAAIGPHFAPIPSDKGAIYIAADGTAAWQSPAWPVEADCTALDITAAFAESAPASLRLVWHDGTSILREDTLRPVPAAQTPMLRGMGLHPPLGARHVYLALPHAGNPDTPPWTSLEVRAYYARVPMLKVFYNQIGYDALAPKRVVAATSFSGTNARIQLLKSDGDKVYEVQMADIGRRIRGAYDTDWGAYYWSGDCGAFQEPGTYTLRVSIEGAQIDAGTLRIAPMLLWDTLLPAAIETYAAQACGNGRYGDCAEGSGWYDDTQTPNLDPLPHTRALLNAFGVARWRFDEDPDAPRAPLLAEADRGARALLAQYEAQRPDFDAPRRAATAAVLAKAARHLPQGNDFKTAAATLLFEARAAGESSTDLLAAAIDLFVATQDERFKNEAVALFTGPRDDAPETSVDYETHIDESYPTSFYLAMKLKERAETLRAQADNPFGVYAPGAPKAPNFFAAPPLGSNEPLPQGNSMRLLDAALKMAQAYRYHPTPENEIFILDQINWLCGANPLGICLIEGLGTRHLPAYARTLPGLPRGALPGAIAAGITCPAAGEDAPWLDLATTTTPEPRSNACPLLLNGRLIEVLANYKRLRLKH